MIDRAVVDPSLLMETSEVYLGQWNQLVSTTNWEKGRIILQWREALIAAGADAAEFADEVWSRQVGNVSGQHVGRLRRVFERFGNLRQLYGKLYWSHFQAALDWDDAEMWLEGALQSSWSISEMRRQRWEAIGAPDDLKPNDDDIVVAEVDEDSTIASLGDDGSEEPPFETETLTGTARETRADSDDSDDDEDDDKYVDDDPNTDPKSIIDHSATQDSRDDEPRFEPVRPFADLPDLPADLSDAFDSFKLAILRHKLAGWEEISQADLLAALDSLKQLATAPTE